jgi:hypothetical protein
MSGKFAQKCPKLVMAGIYTDYRSGKVVRLPTDNAAKKNEKWTEKPS